MSDQSRDANDSALEVVSNLIRSRRTINLFEPDVIGPDVLLDAIELARWAPNHRMTEPWRFYLLGKRATAAAIDCWSTFEAELKGEAAGAARRKRLQSIPGHFILTSRKDEDDLIELENYAACCCAAQNLMLYLWQRGIGVKWTTGGITRAPQLYELIDIDPAAERIVGYFWYGRPKLVSEQKRRAVAEIVSELD